jgi:four helix bundle protein
MAQGSNYEVETQLIVGRRLHFGKTGMLDEAEALSREVGKMLNSLLSAVAAKRAINRARG